MPLWATASVPFFIYVAGVAITLPRLGRGRRMKAVCAAAFGLLLVILAARTAVFPLRLVVLPPLTLLVAYWASGLLWTGPMPRIERFLVGSDERLCVNALSSQLPRAITELLEFAYAGVYPLIPIALVLHLWFTPFPDADRFWTVILVTDYICFGMLPWIQTRPPRALDPRAPWRSRFRSVNLKLLGHTSIGVNTMPSGHAAEAIAAALLVADAPLAISAWMWAAALGISAGAVFGRYHYAIDAIAGWAVAVTVWCLS